MQRKIDLPRLTRFFWALVVLFLPVTSFRFFPFLGRDTMVRPLAYYPLAILAILLLIRLFRREIKPKWNVSVFLLLVFVGISIATSVIGAAMDPIPMHGQNFLGRDLRAWATMLGGLVFFFCALTMNRSEDDLKFTVKFLLAGVLISAIWGAIQACMYFLDFPPKPILNQIQLSFSIRKLLVKPRVAGFAYEPSWLANQIATIYLPWILGITLAGFQVLKRRWIAFIGLGLTVGLLLVTFSRGGILIAAGSTLIVLLITRLDWIKNIFIWLVRPVSNTNTSIDRLRLIGIRTGVIVVFLSLLAALGVTLAQNKYFAQIWRSNKTNLIEYAVDVYAGPRLAYAEAAWHIFEAHPWTGVGMGASGLTLYDHLPEWSLTTLSEITRQLTPEGTLYPNPKNLFLRVLAETGWIGFGVYLVFILTILLQLIRMKGNGSPYRNALQMGGLLTWFAVFFFNFTQDSWIDPNAWFGFAIICGILVNETGTSKRSDQ